LSGVETHFDIPTLTLYTLDDKIVLTSLNTKSGQMIQILKSILQ